MYPDVQTLKTILLKGNYISAEDSKAAEAASPDSAGYIEYLIREELLTKTLLGQALAEAYKLPFADFGTAPATKETVAAIAEEDARASRVVFVKETDKAVFVASDVPEKVATDKIAQYFKGKKLQLAYTLPEYIEASFDLYAKSLDTRFSQIIEAGRRVAPEIVDEIIKDAQMYHASDIHFEPQNSEVTVRFRVDGTLRQAGTIPLEYYDNILNRIKVESGMRIDEHLAPQDGSIRRVNEHTLTDLRVSLIPTVEGEKVVMRVLSSYVQGFTLADLGLDEAHRQELETYAAKPFGMILTVGPTGSGKSTTLYALLKLLNRPGVNITTIEDPVEYKMTGVNQIQVREQSNVTFARGLRAIVRQDPDIILVGEIRDQETAEISVNAALTGHLLLSTFHANDAATAIPRLIDMGIEPFLLASTLEVVIAQRLVRKLCSHCRFSQKVTEALGGIKNGEQVAPYFKKNDTVYAGKGCAVCNGTGYIGRMAVFEFIEVTPEMQDLILQSPSTQEIERLARAQHSIAMFQDGIQKVLAGQTSIVELLRVVELPRKRK